MNFRKIKRNFRRNTKAISPVIATLLMIAIAVVASLVTYAWVMGYMGSTTDKTGKSIMVQSAAHGTGSSNLYVQNTGDSFVKFSTTQSVYINGTLLTTGVSFGANIATDGTLLSTATGTIILSDTNSISWVPAHGDMAAIKLTTVDGTQTQYTWRVP